VLSSRVVRCAVWLGMALLATLALSPALAQAKGRVKPTAKVREIPVSFSVVNQDASKFSCQTDGKRYTISGTLILPAGAVPHGVTLYAHGLGYSSYFWDYTGVPGYNYAGYEADHRHASVIIDRLGYGASGKPVGTESCLGGQATTLHEIVTELRSGDYTADSATKPSFRRIGLVGHSIGGEIAEIEAYSFGDIDALGVMDFNDGDYSPAAYGTFSADIGRCATGGQNQSAGEPGGYSPFGGTAAAFDAVMFNPADTNPAVEAAANARRSLDPCGDVTSLLGAAATSATKIGSINVPIAYVWGQDDALFPGPLPWAATQEALYTASPKVSNFELPGSGHAVTLEKTAPLLQSDMNGWLTANGL
jgi:pimeloyl-ACP methyl ester carboxylesterase